MTSQVLVPSRLSELSYAQTLANEALTEALKVINLSDLSTLSSHQDLQRKLSKLPYQATHQVELLHLQAETEALLQQLQTLKQQRLMENSHAD
jgi:RNase adaptor protein for sRNA GlmZ degradation